MELEKLLSNLEECKMTTSNLYRRIIAKLEGFNERLEARLRKNRALQEQMREEGDFKKSMGYMLQIFGFKGGN